MFSQATNRICHNCINVLSVKRDREGNSERERERERISFTTLRKKEL
jgi:hypothetical protein